MTFLLVDETEGGYWQTRLAAILAPLGLLKVTRPGAPFAVEPDGLILVDATTVNPAETVVRQLRGERPARRIVVMTAVPDWEPARAAFEAGAIDYLPKTLPPAELRETFRQLLEKPLPPWPR